MVAIKNYTTEVNVYKSLGEIQEALAKHGARQIMVEYDDGGQPVGVTFGAAGIYAPGQHRWGYGSVPAAEGTGRQGPGGQDGLAECPGLGNGSDGDHRGRHGEHG